MTQLAMKLSMKNNLKDILALAHGTIDSVDSNITEDGTLIRFKLVIEVY